MCYGLVSFQYNLANVVLAGGEVVTGVNLFLDAVIQVATCLLLHASGAFSAISGSAITFIIGVSIGGRSGFLCGQLYLMVYYGHSCGT